MKAIRFFGLAAAGMTAIFACGCASIPAEGPVKTSLVSPQRDASVFWARHSMGSIAKAHGKRVAIAQFAVEFVTHRIEPVPCGCPAAEKKNFQSAKSDFGEGMKLELPGMLCELMRQKEDIHFVPIQEVSASKAYAKFKGLEMGQKIGAKHPDESTSDCGRPVALTIYTVDGLKILDPGQADNGKIMMELLDELKVDSVLRVKLRVGVFQGVASIEDESSIEAFGPDYFGNLESIRTLLGEKAVYDKELRPAPGQIVYHISSAKYCEEIRELFFKYLTMASIVSAAGK